MTVFINKGDAPLTPAQAINRGLALYNSEMALYQREAGMLTGSQAFATWANQWLTDNAINAANNAWNVELATYRQAMDRLAHLSNRASLERERRDVDESLVTVIERMQPVPAVQRQETLRRAEDRNAPVALVRMVDEET